VTLQQAATLGGLQLLSPIGSGGQATVFRARRADGREVALKVIEPRGGREGERARREARALAGITHPSLPRCERLIEDPGGGWLALELELIEGRGLDEVAPLLDLAARRRALRHVAAALAHLHAHDVVHRDVKPGNVVIGHDFAASPGDAARCKLVDLGIAVRTGNPAPITELGHPGTVTYMAPEALDPVAFPAPRGAATLDVFSFGVTAWVVLRGVHPSGLPLDGPTGDFAHAYDDHVGAEHLFLPPEDLDDPFERVIARCLRLRASERPRDGAALVALLDAAMGASEHAAPRPARSTTLKASGPAAGPAPSQSQSPSQAESRSQAPSQAPWRAPSRSQARPASAPIPRAAPTAPLGPVRIPAAPTVVNAPSRSARRGWMLAVAGAALAALVAAGWMLGIPGGSRSGGATPTAGLTNATVPPPSAQLAPPPSGLDWSSVRESNVLHSTTHACETKVLAGWFRARCATRPGETLRITAPPDAGAHVTSDATATTLLIPLAGRDRVFVFDWTGGRGTRTLHVVGREVEHRVIQSQGEFSAP
jgi:serine/threonine protein kinase